MDAHGIHIGGQIFSVDDTGVKTAVRREFPLAILSHRIEQDAQQGAARISGQRGVIPDKVHPAKLNDQLRPRIHQMNVRGAQIVGVLEQPLRIAQHGAVRGQLHIGFDPSPQGAVFFPYNVVLVDAPPFRQREEREHERFAAQAPGDEELAFRKRYPVPELVGQFIENGHGSHYSHLILLPFARRSPSLSIARTLLP